MRNTVKSFRQISQQCHKNTPINYNFFSIFQSQLENIVEHYYPCKNRIDILKRYVQSRLLFDRTSTFQKSQKHLGGCSQVYNSPQKGFTFFMCRYDVCLFQLIDVISCVFCKKVCIFLQQIGFLHHPFVQLFSGQNLEKILCQFDRT